MNTQDIDVVIANVMSAILARQVSSGENIIRKNEELWNSLKHMQLIFSVESVFGIEFTEEDIALIVDVVSLKSKIEVYRAA